MRKLIETNQEYLIQCDNPECDYKVVNQTGDPSEDISSYLNQPCPLCGENLLTEQDYIQALKLMKVVKWLNKWFSWLTLFSSKKNHQSVKVHVHNGVKIEGE
jgi:hypothetical protein